MLIHQELLRHVLWLLLVYITWEFQCKILLPLPTIHRPIIKKNFSNAKPFFSFPSLQIFIFNCIIFLRVVWKRRLCWRHFSLTLKSGFREKTWESWEFIEFADSPACCWISSRIIISIIQRSFIIHFFVSELKKTSPLL